MCSADWLLESVARTITFVPYGRPACLLWSRRLLAHGDALHQFYRRYWYVVSWSIPRFSVRFVRRKFVIRSDKRDQSGMVSCALRFSRFYFCFYAFFEEFLHNFLLFSYFFQKYFLFAFCKTKKKDSQIQLWTHRRTIHSSTHNLDLVEWSGAEQSRAELAAGDGWD